MFPKLMFTFHSVKPLNNFQKLIYVKKQIVSGASNIFGNEATQQLHVPMGWKFDIV